MSRCAALLCLALLAAGCQDYNFNPVGKCVIQPGVTRLKADAIGTADLLFVVDDSGSMAASQANLAQNFTAFIDELAKTQADRKQRGLQALDFHIAITTSSVYENFPPTQAAVCSDAGGGLACSFSSQVDPTRTISYACTNPPSTPPQACSELIGQYWGFSSSSHPACIAGPGAEGRPYPAGDFVAAAGNPKVLHFTKDLAWETWGTGAPDPRISDLVTRFQQNIAVGTCGSGQEQHLESGRLAIQKALRQGGRTQPADVAAADFPHPGAKLVVVYVGDEDDCSAPADPNRALVTNGAYDVQDVCVADWRQPDPANRHQTAIEEYVDQLIGLGRPVGAAFIFSSNCTVGPDGRRTCQPGVCGCTAGPTNPSSCVGRSSGTRLKELATALEARKVGVVEASVCDASFASTLKSIAELVKPPSGLQLPSTPASSQVAVLRIVGAGGNTTRVCNGPAVAGDWWFVDCNDASAAPRETPTSCIAIRPGSACEADPGETYSAEYLGVVPSASERNPLGGCGAASTQSSECSQLMGGRAQDWTCEVPTGLARGTCLCNANP